MLGRTTRARGLIATQAVGRLVRMLLHLGAVGEAHAGSVAVQASLITPDAEAGSGRHARAQAQAIGSTEGA